MLGRPFVKIFMKAAQGHEKIAFHFKICFGPDAEILWMRAGSVLSFFKLFLTGSAVIGEGHPQQVTGAAFAGR